MKQRLLKCLSVFSAVILFVFCHFSNARAEEVTDTTQTIAELAAEGGYTEINLDSYNYKLEKENQAFSTKEYTYGTSYAGMENVTANGYGALYKVTIGSGLVASISCSQGSIYVYDESFSLISYDKISNATSPDEKIYYVWIVKNEGTLSDNFMISFITGDRIYNYFDKAQNLEIDKAVIGQDDSDNHLNNIAVSSYDILNGWLFKNELSGRYVFDTSDSYTIYLFDDRGDMLNSQFGVDKDKEINLSGVGYVFIVKNIDDISFTLMNAKPLSEKGFPILKKGEKYTTKSDDLTAELSRDGQSTEYYLYGFSIEAGETISLSAATDNIYTNANYSIYTYEGEYYTSELESNISIGQKLVLSNKTDEIINYWLAIPSNLYLTVTIQYNTLAKTLDEQRDKAIDMKPGDSLSFEKDDTRFVSRQYNTSTGTITEEDGAFIKAAIPAGETAKFAFDDGQPSSYYAAIYKYTDLGTEPTTENKNFMIDNSNDVTMYVFFFIPKMYSEGAKFTIDVVQTKSYTDVKELQIGENTMEYDGIYVSYPTINGTERWDGTVYHLSIPDNNRYVVRMDYTGDAESFYGIYGMTAYTMDASGYMTWNFDSHEYMLGRGDGEVNTTGYFILQDKKEFWLQFKLENPSDMGSMAQDAPNIRITIQKLDEIKEADIPIAEAGKTYQVKSADYTVGIYDGLDISGSIYKLNIPSGHKVTLTSTNARVYKKEANEWKNIDTLNGVGNDSDNDVTYYVVCSQMGESASYSVTFGSLEAMEPLESIDEAEIPELTVGNSLDLSTLKKKRIGFTQIGYFDNTKEDSSFIQAKYEGYWIKFTIPEGKMFSTSGTVESSSAWYAYTYYEPYEAYKIEYDFYGNSADHTYQEGTYYLCLPSNKGSLTLSDIPSIDTIKDQALEVSAEDLVNGTFKCKAQSKMFTRCVSNDKGIKSYEVGYGALIKFTIPAGKIYNTSCSSVYKENAFNDIVDYDHSSKIYDNDQTYYAWVTAYEPSAEIEVTFKSLDNLITFCLEAAEALQVGSKTSFKYDIANSAYKDKITFLDFSQYVNLYHAKVYKLERGVYNITTQFKQEDVQLTAHIFNKDGDYLYANYSLNASNTSFQIAVYDTNYIVFSDQDQLDIQAEISVDTCDDNRLVACTEKIPLLEEGENNYEYGHAPSYLVVSNGFSTKEYAASWGVWYRCIINPHTTTQIDIPMSGDLNIYEDPDAVYSKYYEGYGGIYPYTYTNDTDEAKEIYLNLNTVTGTPSSDKIVVTSTKKADKLVTMKEQAIALTEGTYTTTSDNLLTAQVPYGYYEDETTVHYSQNTGKLYAITIPSKYTVYMNANKGVIGLYSDLEVPALWCEEGGLSCYNLTDKEIIYYLWVDGDNDAVTLNISYEAMEVDSKEEENEDGEKVKVEDTKVPTEDDNTTIIVSESKDLTTDQPKDTVVKVENDKFSEDAIMKSIEVAGTKQEQYDKEDCPAQVSIKAEIKDDTDATISKNVIDSIKNLPTAVDLEISKKDEDGNVEYTWNFKADSIANLDTNKVPSVNTKVDIFQDAVGYDKKDELENLTEKDSKNCVVSFQHEGLLPDNTEVSIKVGSEYEEGSTLYYYHIDAGKLTFVGSAVVKNGYVPLTISHCSDYVISDMKVGEEVHPVEAIKISAGDADVKNVEVASTINLVAIVSPKNADDTSVTWSSSDDAIATVDEKTGVVTAVSQGEVTIKATANDGSDVFGEIKLKVIEKVCKHGNTEVRNAKEASCTEEGYTGDTYCVDCNTKLATGEVIAKKDHTSSDWIVDKAATVEAEGSRHKECTVCKTVLVEEAIAKLPSPTPTPDPEPTPEPVVIPDVTIRYTTHVQTFGWQGDENNASKWFVNGKMAGTSGKAKRLEGIKIRVYGNDNLGIQYTTHCQSYGWLPWSANGEMNGTEGEAKRLEAIKIQLTGADKDKYDVYYRVHAQSYGWLGWAKNGAPSGTAGYAKRLEGIQVVVVKKGAAAPGLNYAGVNAASGVHQTASYVAKAGSSPVVGNQATSNTNPSVAGEANVNVAYRTHVQTFGWQGWKYNGQMSGTSGQAKRLEGINIKLTNKPYSGSIVYTTHVQTYGWQGNENNPNTWKRDGDMSGTSGEAKRLEAIRIALTGEMAEHYDVYYRVHAQSFGWLGWAKNGEAAGTAGLAKRLEGIQIVLVPKGGNAPARSYQGITSVKTQAYIKK